jgi:hypothetical protein
MKISFDISQELDSQAAEERNARKGREECEIIINKKKLHNRS